MTTIKNLDKSRNESKPGLGSPKKKRRSPGSNNNKPGSSGSGSLQSCSLPHSRETSDLNASDLMTPNSAGLNRMGTSSGRGMRRGVGERLFDIRPLTRDSTNVMETLPEGRPLTQGSRPLTREPSDVQLNGRRNRKQEKRAGVKGKQIPYR